jgi:hypothetical protein
MLASSNLFIYADAEAVAFSVADVPVLESNSAVGYVDTGSTEGCGDGDGLITTAGECAIAAGHIDAKYVDTFGYENYVNGDCIANSEAACVIVPSSFKMYWTCWPKDFLTDDKYMIGYKMDSDVGVAADNANPNSCSDSCTFSVRCAADSDDEVVQPIGRFEMKAIDDKGTLTVDPTSFDATGSILVLVSQEVADMLGSPDTYSLYGRIYVQVGEIVNDECTLSLGGVQKDPTFIASYTEDADAVTVANDNGAEVVKVGYGLNDISNIGNVYADDKLTFCVELTYQAKADGPDDPNDWVDFSKIVYFMEQDITISGDLQFDVGPLTITSSDDKKDQTFDALTIEQDVTASICERKDGDSVDYQASSKTELFVGDSVNICVYTNDADFYVDDIVEAECSNILGGATVYHPIINDSTMVNSFFTKILGTGKTISFTIGDFIDAEGNSATFQGFETSITSEYIGSLTCTGEVTLSSTTAKRRGLQLSSNEVTLTAASGTLDDGNSGKFAVNINIVGGKGQGNSDNDSQSLSSAAATVYYSAEGMVALILAAAVVFAE